METQDKIDEILSLINKHYNCDQDKVCKWLNRPIKILDNQKPGDMLNSEKVHELHKFVLICLTNKYYEKN